MKKPETQLSSLLEELTPLAGQDATLARMLKMKRPLNLETYLAMSYPDGVPAMTAELRAEVPEPLRRQAEEPEAGPLRIAWYRHQNAQLLKRARGG